MTKLTGLLFALWAFLSNFQGDVARDGAYTDPIRVNKLLAVLIEDLQLIQKHIIEEYIDD